MAVGCRVAVVVAVWGGVVVGWRFGVGGGGVVGVTAGTSIAFHL